MTRKTWRVEARGHAHDFEVDHGYWSARRRVRVDGAEVFSSRPRSFREQTDLWQTSTDQAFMAHGHRCALRVRPGLARYDIDLIVDGRSAEDGLPAGPVRRPALPPYGWAAVKITIAFLVLLAYGFVVIGPVFAHARASGDPRWILLVNALVDAALPAFALALVVFAWQSEHRWRNVTLALAVFGLTAYAFRGAPVEAIDLALPFDEEAIEFRGWEDGPIVFRHATMRDGPEVEFASGIPVRWRRLPPGSYVFVRGHLSRVIVDVRPVAEAP